MTATSHAAADHSADQSSGVRATGLRRRTEERILEGALEAVGRHGLRKIGIADVSELAGVSRGTIYRYFRSKEDLLVALARYEQRRYERGLEQALASVAPGDPSISAMIDFALDYFAAHPFARGMATSEPAFVVEYITSTFPRLQKTMVEYLGTDLDGTGMVRAGAIERDELSQLLIRLLVSIFLIPPDDASALRASLHRLVSLDRGTSDHATAIDLEVFDGQRTRGIHH